MRGKQEPETEETVQVQEGPKPNIYGNIAEKFYVVSFTGREKGSMQPDRVPLTVNGEVLLVKRGIPVPLPDYFVECAENASEARYEPDKETGYMTFKGMEPVFTFSVFGEVSKETYERLRKITLDPKLGGEGRVITDDEEAEIEYVTRSGHRRPRMPGRMAA
ncbi:MAG: hypothetical protein V2A77_02715 [Pseudomonadota bacterium]